MILCYFIAAIAFIAIWIGGYTPELFVTMFLFTIAGMVLEVTREKKR